MSMRASGAVGRFLQSDPRAKTLTPAEAAVLWAIAEQTRDHTGKAYRGRDGWDLAARARLGERALRKSLARLAAAGLEVRVVQGIRADGAPLVAHNGRQVEYRLPAAIVGEVDGTSVPSTQRPDTRVDGTSVPSTTGVDGTPGPSTDASRRNQRSAQQVKELQPVEVHPVAARSRSAQRTPNRRGPNPPPTPDELAGFRRFWDHYPWHAGEDDARAAYVDALRAGADPDDIDAGAQRYRDKPHRDPRLTMAPANWLKGRRWRDEGAAAPPPKPPIECSDHPGQPGGGGCPDCAINEAMLNWRPQRAGDIPPWAGKHAEPTSRYSELCRYCRSAITLQRDGTWVHYDHERKAECSWEPARMRV